MADKKVLVVMGATGAQGGGLVRAVLDDPAGEFAVRAVTRDPSSEKARALAESGAEVVQGDLTDPESIKRAFQGAYGAFCVTFFWDHFSPEREYEEARLMANAAKEAGLQHVIWSTLEDTRKFMSLDDDRMPTLQGKYKVPHLDAKGAADDLFREAGVPTTFLLTSFYWENFIFFGLEPKRSPDGKLAIVFPMGDKPLPGIAAEDIGKCAYGIFKRPDLIGKTVGIVGEQLTGFELAEKMSRATGHEISYYPIDADTFRGFGFPGADDVGNMFQFKRDFSEEFTKVRDVELSKSLNPELQTFDQWLESNKDRIPIAE